MKTKNRSIKRDHDGCDRNRRTEAARIEKSALPVRILTQIQHILTLYIDITAKILSLEMRNFADLKKNSLRFRKCHFQKNTFFAIFALQRPVSPLNITP